MPPGVLFTLQNNLQFVSAAHLPPAVFQVLSQSKLIFTALLGVALLNARPSAAQWASIAVLSCGLLLVSQSARSSHANPVAPCGTVIACRFKLREEPQAAATTTAICC
jgi:drug/metabolite transporter (DMT)-like permease